MCFVRNLSPGLKRKGGGGFKGEKKVKERGHVTQNCNASFLFYFSRTVMGPQRFQICWFVGRLVGLLEQGTAM